LGIKLPVLKNIILKGGSSMSDIHHEDFEKILSIIKKNVNGAIEFGAIRSIESNFDTKGLAFKSKKSSLSDGTIIVGENNGLIAIDVSKADGEVISFVIKELEDKDGINNIISWFSENYKA
jgi:hypothetical protein